MSTHLKVLREDPAPSEQTRLAGRTNEQPTTANISGKSDRTPSGTVVLVRIIVFLLIVPAVLIYLAKLLLE